MVAYRDLHTIEDMLACIELQMRVWQFDPIDVVPLPILVITAQYGGFLHGAFAGNRLVGFVYSFPVRGFQRWLHWSHMLAVDPEYQGQGIGAELKFRQRAFAQSRGYDLVAWTFDPLETRNAYFNFCKLGVIGRLYKPNIYGQTSSTLHWGLPTDRLVAEWWVHLRPQQLWPDDPQNVDAVIPRPVLRRNRPPQPGAVPDTGWPPAFWVPVPDQSMYPKTRRARKAYRARWQHALRTVMTRAFAAGYVAVHFTRSIPNLGMPGYWLVHGHRLAQPLPDW